MRYFVKPVVCDYGIYRLDGEKRKLIEICNSRSNAEMVAEILNSDDKHEVWGRPQGEWVVDENGFSKDFRKCSNCNEDAEWLDSGSPFLSNFCPNCGADMRGGKE